MPISQMSLLSEESTLISSSTISTFAADSLWGCGLFLTERLGLDSSSFCFGLCGI